MDLTKGTATAFFRIIVTDKKATDKFDFSGNVSTIHLTLRELNASFKINICGRELTEKDFNMREEYSWQLSQSSIQGYLKGKRDEIKFVKNGVFEIEQPSVNVWNITIWITQLENKQESNKSFFE